MWLKFAVLVCIILVNLSSGNEQEPRQCDGCTRLSCESGFIERLVRLEIDNENLKKRLSLVEKEETKPVSFKYRFSSDKKVTDGSRLMFDVPVFDVGNAYDVEKGEFRAPVAGLYSITPTICTNPARWMVAGVMKNGILISQFISGDNSYHTCNSETTITGLLQDDRVWVMKMRGTSISLTQDYGWNSFSVSLITADPGA